MNRVKILIAFTFLLAFAVCVSAQENRYPNELEGLELMANSKFKVLIPYVSTSEEVMRVYGKECKNSSYCELDENWSIGFYYVGSRGGKENLQITGKLSTIVFYPRKNISFSDIKFSNKFKMSSGGQSHPSAVLRYYEDKFGLTYVVLVNSKEIDLKEGDLLRIEYSVSDEEEEKYWNTDN